VPRAGLSRDDVVAAAAELIDEIGYHKLTMGRVRRAAGIQRLPVERGPRRNLRLDDRVHRPRPAGHRDACRILTG